MRKVLFIIGGILLAAVVFYLVKITQFYKYIYTPIPKSLKPLMPKPEKETFTVLLLGYAGGTHAGTYLTDTMILMHINKKTKKVLMVSLPRDLWVKLPTKSGDDFHSKINTVYETELFPNDFPDLDTKKAGSKTDAELTKKVVAMVTGLDVDNYISIDFDSFTKAIDILGGVDINVQKTFDDYKYPAEGKEDDLCGKEEQFKLIEPFLEDTDASSEAKDKLLKEKPELDEFLRNATDSPELAFPCRYEKIRFEAGSQHMDGTTALKFSRSRQSPQDGGDFARARRQQLLLEAVREKILSVGFIARLPALLDETKNYVKTDVGPDQIQKFLKEVTSAKEYKLTSIVLSDQNVLDHGRSDSGQYILVPENGIDQWSSVQKFIKNTILEITPTLSISTPNPTE